MTLSHLVGTALIVAGCAWLIPAGFIAFRNLVRMARRGNVD